MTVDSFKGDSWEECSLFIQNVRAAAWKEGKSRDYAWMADFAAMHFAGDGLLWFSTLSQEIQEDWLKLQAAIAAQWGRPTTSALQPENIEPSARNRQSRTKKIIKDLYHGIIKVVQADSEVPCYLHLGETFYITTLEDVSRALIFGFKAGATSKWLEIVETPWPSWLAIQWVGTGKPDVGRGSEA